MVDQARCGSCLYWNRSGAALAAAVRDPSVGAELGTCEAAPPVVVSPTFTDDSCPIGNGIAMFPVTHSSRRCGLWTDEDGPPQDPAREDLPTADILPMERAVA